MVIQKNDGSVTRGRPVRRDEEEEPGRDYVARMELAGPRQRESWVSFRGRVAAVVESRRLWIHTYCSLRGNFRLSCEQLGVDRRNGYVALQRVGLSTEVLQSYYQDFLRAEAIGGNPKDAEG